MRNQTILHPTDFSENSERAFLLACSLARDYNSRLIVLHVAPPPAVAYGVGVMPLTTEDTLEQLRDKLRELQSHQSKVEIETHLIEGDPQTEIVKFATENDCDLIVMGTHGRSGLARLLMGSVAEQVVRKAKSSVLTVKMPTLTTNGSQAKMASASRGG